MITISKSVLVSIQPYYVFLIIAKAMGWNITQEKTIEVRKTIPKDKNWDRKTIIYCSKNKMSFAKIPKEYQPLMEGFLGRVVGEFVCDWVKSTPLWRIKGETGFCAKRSDLEENLPKFAYLSIEELKKYAGSENRLLYYWHISDLVIYDKPRELSEFYNECEKPECEDCPYLHFENTPNSYEGWCEYDEKIPIKRPPQSWCYIEGVT